MSKRVYDPVVFRDGCVEVQYTKNAVMIAMLQNGLDATKVIEDWLEPRVTGPYLILLQNVIFANEKDAMIFKLGFIQGE